MDPELPLWEFPYPFEDNDSTFGAFETIAVDVDHDQGGNEVDLCQQNDSVSIVFTPISTS